MCGGGVEWGGGGGGMGVELKHIPTLTEVLKRKRRQMEK